MVFRIDSEVFERLEGLCVGVVVARGFLNDQDSPEVTCLLDEAMGEARGRLEGMHASDDPRVQPYRQAFHRLGMSPSRYPSSNIALLRRIAKGKGLARISPVVDLGNAISIRFGVPLGSHAIEGDGQELCLRLSREGDVFVPRGADAPDPTLTPGELVYAQGDLVHTRRWTWQQGEAGKISADTRDAVFPIDGFTGVNDEVVMRAAEELARGLERFLGARCQTYLTDAAHPSVA